MMTMAFLKLPSCSFMFLWFLMSSRSSTGKDTMELGSSLTPSSSPLLSSSSAFVLSFRAPPALAASSFSDLYLAISFAVSLAGPPAWVANRDGPVSSNATLTLSRNGDLSLSDPSLSFSTFWSSGTSDKGVVRAQLLDSGNLVLINNKSDHVWESFLYPTDTLLPGQNFTDTLLPGQNFTLKSSETAGLFNTGNYTLGFSSDGIFQLSSQASYWTDWGPVASFWFDLVESNITLHNSSSIIQTLGDVVNGSSSYRLTLDVDGNLRMYGWDTSSAVWKNIWMAFNDVCSRVPNVCGDYGICMYSPQPTCICPQGFSVKDPTILSSGCIRNEEIPTVCNTHIKYAELENVDFPSNDIISSITHLSINECKDLCFNNCSCMAAIYWQSDISGPCFLKEKLRNGYYVASQQHRVFIKMSDNSSYSSIEDTSAVWSSQHFLQQSSSNASNPVAPNNVSFTTNIQRGYKESTVIALSVLVGVQAVCLAVACMVLFKSRKKLRYLRLHGELEGVSRSPLAFSFQEIEAATENFSHKLGEGGFGTVYKGKLKNGTLIAVKRLEGVSQQEKQFRAEIATLGHIHHMNLLRLVGFCSEGAHRLLVYEFMENGSLDQILFQGGSNATQLKALDWGMRFQVCLGVARGVHYLHEECLDCILHCDIKPQNILLDGSFSAKVADFGLAYLYSRDHTVKMTTIRGTRGYLAPEWVLNLPITDKADVFSYGMLVMEIISGRKNYLYTESSMMDSDDKWCFPVWAYGKKMEDVVDTRMDRALINYQQVELVLKLAFACIQGDRNVRPSMGRVVQMLEGMLPIPDSPPPSLFPSHPADKHALSSSVDPSSGMNSSSSSTIAGNLHVYPGTTI